MDYMATQPDNAFDLAIVDPPYGIGMHNTGGASKRGYGERVEKNGAISKIKHFERTDKTWDSSPMGGDYYKELRRVSENQIIWGANHFISRMPIDSSCWIVWDKRNGDSDFADCELAHASFKSAVRMFSYRWCGMVQEKQNKRLAEKRIHPTQKPVDLYRWLLENYGKQGQRILDTHLGSGIAAHYFGCDFVGCELDEDYYNAACERFDMATRQAAMF